MRTDEDVLPGIRLVNFVKRKLRKNVEPTYYGWSSPKEAAFHGYTEEPAYSLFFIIYWIATDIPIIALLLGIVRGNTLVKDNWVAILASAELLIYFAPTVLAFNRVPYPHPRPWLVLLINVFFGVTGVGWLLALLIAATNLDPIVRMTWLDKTIHKLFLVGSGKVNK